MTRRRIAVGDVSLAVADEGSGTPVLLLHGFPDSSNLWRNQLPALRAAGLRVIAPDLRGFGESDKPAAAEDYAIGHSVRDMVGLLDALELQRVHVVGHDWGAAVAWTFAALQPDRVDRLVALSVGHPATRRQISIAQREKAWYMLFFQFVDVAEELLQRDDWRLFRELAGGAADLERYVADLSRQGALTAALNWHRANAAPQNELRAGPPLASVAAPTLGIWSSGDRYLLEDRMLASAAHVTSTYRYERSKAQAIGCSLTHPNFSTRC
jgi:pimeloyl-ACP methyl ester carboxylesterase